MLGYDKDIKMGYTGGRVIGTILGNVDRIILGIDIGTELVFLDGSLDGSNEGKI